MRSTLQIQLSNSLVQDNLDVEKKLIIPEN